MNLSLRLHLLNGADNKFPSARRDPTQRADEHPFLRLTPEEQQRIGERETNRRRLAEYFDPLYDPAYFNPYRWKWPSHLEGKTGAWYLPPPEGIQVCFKLSDEEKMAISVLLLGEMSNYYRRTVYQPAPYLLMQVPILEKPPDFKPKDKTLENSPNSTTGLERTIVENANGRVRSRITVDEDLSKDQFDEPRYAVDSTEIDCSSSDDEEENNPKRKEEVRVEMVKRARIHRFFLNDLNLDLRHSERDQTTALAFMSIKVGSLYDYCSCLHGIVKRGYQLTEEGVQRFVREQSHNFTSGTINQHHNAFKHYRKAMGLAGEAQRTEAVFAGSCIEKACANTKVRGSIVQSMARELVESDAVKKKPAFRDLYILLSASGVRSNQLRELRVSDCWEDEKNPGVWQFTVVKNHKGVKSRGPSDATEIHHTNPFWKHEIKRIVSEARSRITKKDSNPHILKEWDIRKGTNERKLLAEQAKRLKWPSELSWVLHSFRNGACCDAFLRNASKGDIAAFAAAQKVTGHVTLQMLRHYAIPNIDRIKYQKMKMDHCLLRVTGIVTDNLTGRYCSAAALPKLVSQSSMKNRGNEDEWKSHQKRVKREEKEKKKTKATSKAKKKVSKKQQVRKKKGKASVKVTKKRVSSKKKKSVRVRKTNK